MQICLLGTASGLPARDRFGQTIVLTPEPSVHYLLDVGDGASSLLMRHGFDHRHLRGLFISHMHADHHGGFAQVVKTCMHLERRDELLVLAPAEGIAPLQAYLDASYLCAPWLGFPLRWVSLRDCATRPFALPDGLTVRSFPNSHLTAYRDRIKNDPRVQHLPWTGESYSVTFDGHGKRLVYSGNLRGPEGADELAPFVEPCDLLIMELAHVEPTALGRFLAGRAIGRTLITHFHPRWNGVPDEVILARIASGAGGAPLSGPVHLARDGDVFSC